jgi:flagellar basal body-associated protein FliL
MAEAAKPKPAADAPADPASKQRWWEALLTQRWLIVLVVGSLLVHAVVFGIARKTAGRAAPPTEYTLGTFSFISPVAGDSHAPPGKFDLHVRFLDELDSVARQRITAHQFRVRESIEDLLRSSAGMNLDDQSLTRLKHQIQQRIDDDLDLRAVAEVIITDLTCPPVGPPPENTVPTGTVDKGPTTPTSTGSAANAGY